MTKMLNFVVPEELIKELDDFRYENRFSSRASAIKWLIKWALAQNPEPTDKDKE